MFFPKKLHVRNKSNLTQVELTWAVRFILPPLKCFISAKALHLFRWLVLYVICKQAPPMRNYWWPLMANPSGWFVVNFPPAWNIVKRLASATITNLSHAVAVVKNLYVTIRSIRSTSTFFEVLLWSAVSLRTCTCSPIEFQTELIFTWQTSTACKKKVQFLFTCCGIEIPEDHVWLKNCSLWNSAGEKVRHP